MRCNTCDIDKEPEEFALETRSWRGRRHKCRACDSVYAKAYYQKHKRRVNKRRVANYKKKHKECSLARLTRRVRTRMHCALNGKKKQGRTMELIGCTPEQLRAHLESQFTEGMAWGQHGRWHVDHVLPLAAFDLTDKKHQSYAFHWSNLSPLWAADNLAKSDSYDPEELEKYLQSELPTYE